MTAPKPRRGRVTAPNVLALANLVKLLEDGTRTCQELADECGLTRLTVYKYCRALHQVGAVHIVMYEKDARNSDTIKIYKLGPGRDAKREVLPKNYQRDNRARAARNASVFSARPEPLYIPEPLQGITQWPRPTPNALTSH